MLGDDPSHRPASAPFPDLPEQLGAVLEHGTDRVSDAADEAQSASKLHVGFPMIETRATNHIPSKHGDGGQANWLLNALKSAFLSRNAKMAAVSRLVQSPVRSNRCFSSMIDALSLAQ